MRTDDKKHQCWLNEGETIRSFHPVLDCALLEFADHDAFVSFIFEAAGRRNTADGCAH